MSAFNNGVERAFGEILIGIISSTFLLAVLNLVISNQILFIVIYLTGILALVKLMPRWSTTYLLGWLFGVYIFSSILDIIQLIIFILAPITIFGYRIKKLFG